MNRNIVWRQDVSRIEQRAAFAGPTQTEDSRAERVLKFIPAEAIGTYSFLVSAVQAGAIKTSSGASVLSLGQTQFFLWAALVVSVVFNWVYLWRIWQVARKSQIFISSIALLAFAFAGGGAFATYGWYKPIYGTFLLGVVAAFLIFAPPPPQAPPPRSQSSAHGS